MQLPTSYDERGPRYPIWPHIFIGRIRSSQPTCGQYRLANSANAGWRGLPH